MLINDILAAERKDPGIWNSLPQLGWEALLRIEKEWRGDGEFKNTKGWFRKVYQKLRRAQQHTQEYKDFRRSILDRDGCCRKCFGASGDQRLQVHHEKSWFAFPELRMDPANCKTLCGKCHEQEDSSVWVTKQLRADARTARRKGKVAEEGEV